MNGHTARCLGAVAALLLIQTACFRETGEYDVQVYGAGTTLDDVQPAPEPMAGVVEYARYRLWGSNLGHGLTGLYGDMPRADGTSFVVSSGTFGYPPDPGFDRNSAFLSPGPVLVEGGDQCFTRTTLTGYGRYSEYVDAGDHLALVAEDGDRIVLERDPAAHVRPAGESWYVGYGGALGPVVTGHELLPDTWRPASTWTLTAPGSLAPPESTIGVVPFPVVGSFTFPPELTGLTVANQPVRPPEHEWEGDDDDVRFPGPWTEGVRIEWEPSALQEPLTIAVRLLGVDDEGACGCGGVCEPGFACEDDRCVNVDGATSNPLGEVVCTVSDDGEFVLKPIHIQMLDAWVDPIEVRGAILLVARTTEGSFAVPDVLSFNGKRIEVGEARTRGLDVIVTRLEAP